MLAHSPEAKSDLNVIILREFRGLLHPNEFRLSERLEFFRIIHSHHDDAIRGIPNLEEAIQASHETIQSPLAYLVLKIAIHGVPDGCSDLPQNNECLMLIRCIIENLSKEELNHGLRFPRTSTTIENIVNLRPGYRSEILLIPQSWIADVNDCHESILACLILLSRWFRHDDHIG